MKHFDSLKAYDNLIEKGMESDKARAIIGNMDSWLKDIANEFVTQKYLTVLTGVLITIGISMSALLFSMKVDIKDMDRRLTSIENYMYMTKR